jgi:pimeloyl-ACP methyl ester carboxylesterase
MSANDLSIVLAHGAWADGSSWSKVIGPLHADGYRVIAAPLPLTSLADDVAALDRAVARTLGPVVLVGHAYAGAVLGEVRSERIKAYVYVAALAPAEGETVADVFYRIAPGPHAPKLAPDSHGLIYLPEGAFATAFAPNASPDEQATLYAVQRPISPACISIPVGIPGWKNNGWRHGCTRRFTRTASTTCPSSQHRSRSSTSSAPPASHPLKNRLNTRYCCHEQDDAAHSFSQPVDRRSQDLLP